MIVSVLGSSVTFWVSPSRESRDDATYLELVRAELQARIPGSQVQSFAIWNGTILDAQREYRSAVQRLSPDVLVLHYGAAEAFPRAYPLRWLWYLHGDRTDERLLRSRVRTLADRGIWPLLRRWQRVFSVCLPRIMLVSPRRFERELRSLLDKAQRDTRCRVIMIEPMDPGERLEHWVPGHSARIEALRAVTRKVAADYPATAVLDPRTAAPEPPSSLLPDGLHLSPTGHAHIAELLLHALDLERAALIPDVR